MVVEAQNNGLIVGLAPDLIDKGVAIMQYADDTVLCISHDPEKALNFKLLLYFFELMSGLKINFQKSELFLIGGDNEINCCPLLSLVWLSSWYPTYEIFWGSRLF
jgi:hypothetical protein